MTPEACIHGHAWRRRPGRLTDDGASVETPFVCARCKAERTERERLPDLTAFLIAEAQLEDSGAE